MEIYQEELRRFRVDSNRAADAHREWKQRLFWAIHGKIQPAIWSILALTTITYLPVMYI